MSPATGADLRHVAERTCARLRARNETLATAESCTGGMIAAALTATAGASDVFWGGIVVYTAEAKSLLAGLEQDVLRRHGPVSTPTSEALAAAVRRRAGSTYGLAVTGWAGPSAAPGGQVGAVHVALSHAGGGRAHAAHFDGDRRSVRTQAAVAALELLRQHLGATQDDGHG